MIVKKGEMGIRGGNIRREVIKNDKQKEMNDGEQIEVRGNGGK